MPWDAAMQVQQRERLSQDVCCCFGDFILQSQPVSQKTDVTSITCVVAPCCMRLLGSSAAFCICCLMLLVLPGCGAQSIWYLQLLFASLDVRMLFFVIITGPLSHARLLAVNLLGSSIVPLSRHGKLLESA